MKVNNFQFENTKKNMSKEPNQFSLLDSIPMEVQLKKMVDNFSYRRIELDELPEPIKSNGLVSRCNSFILAKSGSTEGTCYSFVGIRPDKGDIDEHPFVLYYDHVEPSKSFGGIIHHGNWNERTIPMEPWQIAAISASGLTANFTYKSIPSFGSGSLDDLRLNGVLQGISEQFSILFKNKPR